MSNKIIRGSLDPLIIKLLLDNNRMYGYEICQYVNEHSSEKINISEAALYPALHKLEASGLLDSTLEIANGRPRKYYFITPPKTKEANLKLEEFTQLLVSLSAILLPKPIPHG